MLTDITLKNFKAFEDETLELGPLNILTGLNSSGKSSILQALRLLDEGKALSGLGPLGEYIRNGSSDLCIECAKRHGKKNEKLRFSFDRKSKEISKGGRVGDIVSYISADRFGPKAVLQLNIDEDTQAVGSQGENIVDFLFQTEGLQVPLPLALNGAGLGWNIKEWLRTISPGAEEFDYERNAQSLTGRTMFNKHRSVHVGFGLSYALPIIASALAHSAQAWQGGEGNSKSALLLVENPEAHLHPSGQTMMGKLLSLSASCGLQIVAETHSDHLLNGVRLAVKDGLLPPSDVKVHFFKAGKEQAPTTVEQLAIDKYGMLDHWPDGFFDETEKNLMRLI